MRKTIFKLFYLNVQGLRSSVNELDALLRDYKFDLLCFGEHFLRSEEIESVYLERYKIATHFSRSNMQRGGTLTYIKPNRKFKVLKNLNNRSTELHCEVAAIRITDIETTIITVYRSPNGCFATFVEKMEDILSRVSVSERLVVVGDFNVKFNLKDRESLILCDLMKTFYLNPTVTFNTRGKNCLDNVFIREGAEVVDVSKVYASCSDHDGIAFTFSVNSCVKKVEKYKYRPITETGKNNLFLYLDAALSSHKFTLVGDINVDVNNLIKTIKDGISFSFPYKLKRSSKNSNSPVNWFNNNIRTMRETLNLIDESLEERNTPNMLVFRNDFRSQYRRQIKFSKIMATSHYIQSSSNPSRDTWKLINNYRSEKNKSYPHSFSPDDFNNFFSEIAKQLIGNLDKSREDPLKFVKNVNISESISFRFNEVSQIQVRDAILSLRNSRAMDTYDMTAEIVKSVKEILVPTLTRLFNSSVRSGTFPDAFKIGLVKPLFKSGEPDVINNYRPISILPVLSKIFEKLMKDQIINFFENNTIFSPNQFGFRVNHSTTDAIMSFIETAMNSLEGKEFCLGTFLDLTKAFDCVSHKILLKKLIHYRFSQNACALIDSYLSNRSQFVKVEESLSSMRPVQVGVPQGSILGPVLFLIYINDFPASLSNQSILFADDTTLLNTGQDLDLVLYNGLESQEVARGWYLANELSLNSSKTQTMLFSLRQSEFSNPDSVKFLGVHLDSSFTWHQHVDETAKRLCSVIYLLRSIRNGTTAQAQLIAFHSLFQSRLSYGILVWGHAPYSKRLFGLQRRAVRIIAGVAYRDDCREHFYRLNILTLPSLYIYNCLICAYKNSARYVLNSHIHDYNTRNRNNIRPNFTRLTTSRYSSNYHAVRLYNAVPPDIKQLPLNQFKQKIKTCLIGNAFYSIEQFMQAASSGNLQNVYTPNV